MKLKLCYFITFLLLTEYTVSMGHTFEIQNKEGEDMRLMIQRCMLEIENLKTKVDDQEKTIKELKSKVRHLESEKAHEESKKSENSIPNNKMTMDTVSFSNTNIKTNSSGNYLKDRPVSEIPILKRKKNITERLLQGPVPVDTAGVAFYAYMSSDEINPSRHHTLVFDVVKTNTVSAYNKFTGAFTVPYQGLYVFTSTVYVRGYMIIDIFVNSEVVTAMYPDSGNLGPEISATGIAVVRVNKGDIVVVRTKSEGTPVGNILSCEEVALSSFSGWMIA